MRTIRFFTNLDLPQRFVAELNRNPPVDIPNIGDRIKFPFEKAFDSHARVYERPHEEYFFYLEVVSREWNTKTGDVLIELHIPSSYKNMSIADWENNYNRHVEGR